MEIREVNEFVNWVNFNVLDMPKSGDDIAFRSPDVVSDIGSDIGSDTESDLTAGQTKTRPTWANMNAHTEYDFPMSLLEHILGLDRI